MLTEMKLTNFKSWKETGGIRLAPLTGFFGTNSSGKTSLLQALVLLKQTVESRNRNVVLSTGGPLVDLGTPSTLIFGRTEGQIGLNVSWKPNAPIQLTTEKKFKYDEITFETLVNVSSEQTTVAKTEYVADSLHAEIRRRDVADQPLELRRRDDQETYDVSVTLKGSRIARVRRGPVTSYSNPVSCYGFPPEAVSDYGKVYLDSFEKAFTSQFYDHVLYLGPLREYPERTYTWVGDKPTSIGVKGENAIPALLAMQKDIVIPAQGRRSKVTVLDRIAYWLKQMGLADAFYLQPISKGRAEHEILIQRVASGVRVPITDVGFGISQILPVLVLLFTCEPSSTLIFEQPEIHLHPRAQTVLADAFLEAIKLRSVQIILESHSEHLLRRLQLRVAENLLSNTETAFYFCDNPSGQSQLQPLDLDEFGNIRNWPEDFFGDITGELLGIAQLGIARQLNHAKR